MRRWLARSTTAALGALAATVACTTAPTDAGAFRGPHPFPIPGEPTSIVAGTDGSAVYVVRGPDRAAWTRSTAHAGDRQARNEFLVADRATDRMTAWFGASEQTGLFASQLQPRAGESVVQVIPVPALSSAGLPVTVSSPGAFASDPGDPAIGPGGAAALLFSQGPRPGALAPVLALRPSEADTWLPPVPLATAPGVGRSVLFAASGDAVLRSVPGAGSAAGPSVQRISRDGMLGPAIDLGFAALGLRVTNQLDLTAAFASDGALHTAISMPRGFHRPKSESRLVFSRLPADDNRAVATDLGRSADPNADDPSLSLAPGPEGSMALVASRLQDGRLRVFESRGTARPRLAANLRASSGVAQGAKLLRAPDGGLNLVWFANATVGRGYYGIMESHRRVGGMGFSTPKAISNSALTRGRAFLDHAVQLPDGDVAVSFVRDTTEEGRAYGLIARP